MTSILPGNWELPQTLRERLGSSHGRQRAMHADGHLLLVLNAPPTDDDLQRTGRIFWRSPDGTWRSTAHGNGPQALDTHINELRQRVDALDDRLDVSQRAEEIFAILHLAAPLHRTARNMQLALQQARELLPKAKEIINFRDRAVDVERGAELLYSDAKHALDFTAARKSEELSERMYHMSVSAHRLNLLAALFFPLATLAALFGMNLIHGLEGPTHPIAFWIVLVLGFLTGLILMTIIAVRPRLPDGLKHNQRPLPTAPARKPMSSPATTR